MRLVDSILLLATGIGAAGAFLVNESEPATLTADVGLALAFVAGVLAFPLLLVAAWWTHREIRGQGQGVQGGEHVESVGPTGVSRSGDS